MTFQTLQWLTDRLINSSLKQWCVSMYTTSDDSLIIHFPFNYFTQVSICDVSLSIINHLLTIFSMYVCVLMQCRFHTKRTDFLFFIQNLLCTQIMLSFDAWPQSVSRIWMSSQHINSTNGDMSACVCLETLSQHIKVSCRHQTRGC